MPTALIVLAAGQGTRMKSDLPKVLHEIGGLPLFAHALSSGSALGPDRRILIVGHGGDAVERAALDLDPDIEVIHQRDQNGTGDAVKHARDALQDFDGDIVVLFADTPFIRPETLARIGEARTNSDLVILGFEAADPARYGRLVTNGERLERIVEYKEASPEEQAITLCNSGIMCCSAKLMFELVEQLDNKNEAGELYLTDIVELATARGLSATAVICDEAETLGVNSRADLAAAEAVFQAAARKSALDNGVTLQAPETVFFSADTHLGRDVIVEPHVVFGPGVTVETGARIRAFSHLEGAHVGSGAIVGPYARLRPGAELSNDTRVGNFCEIKNATIGEGSKVNHLSYIGDASIGDGTNIGAGTITCNYDGVMKHRTEIGDRVFIGSDTMLVAPVKVGNDAMTGSGTVITKDVPAEALAISRTPQENRAGLATRRRAKLKAAKSKRQKG